MSAAIISNCGRYRYTLHRKIPQPIRWVKPCLFVMLNPSTADATNDDPTIRRCLGFAEREKCTELTVVNLFALRCTDPSGLAIDHDPVGPENDRHIQEQVARHANGWIVAAWGAHPMAAKRSKHVFPMLGDVYCLGRTKAGMPRHPLYIAAKQPFVKMETL